MNNTHDIQNKYNKLPTTDLLKIWIDNDQDKYRPAVFIAINQILVGRGENLPEQKPYNPPKSKNDIRWLTLALWIIAFYVFAYSTYPDRYRHELSKPDGFVFLSLSALLPIAFASPIVLIGVLATIKSRLIRWRWWLIFISCIFHVLIFIGRA